MPKYLAHVNIAPNDGTDPYTVETEFDAPGYPAAWQRVLSMADRFGGRVTGHKLIQVGASGELLIGPVSAAAVSNLPVVSEAAAESARALTVKAVEPDWYDAVPRSALCPVPKPYPKEEVTSHDSAA